MRLALALAAVLLLGACDHLYGAVDGPVATISPAKQPIAGARTDI